MAEYGCAIKACEDWEKSSYIMKSESRYILDKNMVLHEIIYYRLNTKKIVFHVAIFLLVTLVCVYIMRGRDGAETTRVSKSRPVLVNELDENNIIESVSLEDDTRSFVERLGAEYLSEEDFYSAGSVEGDLGENLQYFINYIYARNGHAFQKGGAIDSLFCEESWYQEIEVRKKITYEDLNEYEQKNCDVLVKILKKEGYR